VNSENRIVQLTEKDFNNILTLNRNLDCFECDKEAVFQLKLKMGSEWFLMGIFRKDNEVNTKINKIELVEGYDDPRDVGC